MRLVRWTASCTQRKAGRDSAKCRAHTVVLTAAAHLVNGSMPSQLGSAHEPAHCQRNRPPCRGWLSGPENPRIVRQVREGNDVLHRGCAHRLRSEGRVLHCAPHERGLRWVVPFSRCGAGGGSMSEWQPIDSAPKDGRPVWVKGADWGDTDRGWHCIWAWWDGDHWREASPHESVLEHLRYWMPLPEAPK